MFPEQLGASWGTVALVVVSTAVVYVALIAYSRLAGLRSFAQMTNFDVAATVALGSMTATTAVSSKISLLQGVIGLGVLFAAQWVVAWSRRRRAVENYVDNRPLLLMRGRRVLWNNLARGQMTPDDLRSKLRLAGVTRLERVRAVVLESTGEVSVLTDDPEGRELDLDIFANVRGRDWLATEDAPPGDTL